MVKFLAPHNVSPFLLNAQHAAGEYSFRVISWIRYHSHFDFLVIDHFSGKSGRMQTR
jgi:hypothetical protein